MVFMDLKWIFFFKKFATERLGSSLSCGDRSVPSRSPGARCVYVPWSQPSLANHAMQASLAGMLQPLHLSVLGNAISSFVKDKD